MPALGVAYGLNVVVDDSLARQPDVYFEGGDHANLVRISGASFEKLMAEMLDTGNSLDTPKVEFCCGRFCAGSMKGWQSLDSADAIFHCFLYLLEGAHLDLSHALARDAELSSEFLECEWFLSEATCLEDAALAFPPGWRSRRPASPAIRRNRPPPGLAR